MTTHIIVHSGIIIRALCGSTPVSPHIYHLCTYVFTCYGDQMCASVCAHIDVCSLRCVHMSVCDSVTHIVTSKHRSLVAMVDSFNKGKLQIASCISFPSLSLLFSLQVICFFPHLFFTSVVAFLPFCCVLETDLYRHYGADLFSFPVLFSICLFLLLAFHSCPSEQCCISSVSLLFQTP